MLSFSSAGHRFSSRLDTLSEEMRYLSGGVLKSSSQVPESSFAVRYCLRRDALSQAFAARTKSTPISNGCAVKSFDLGTLFSRIGYPAKEIGQAIMACPIDWRKYSTRSGYC